MYISIRFLNLLLVLVLIYILYRALWKGEGFGFLLFRKKKRPRNTDKTPAAIIAEMKRDPVCGTYIPENQAISYKQGHETHYFCSEECLQKFQEPQKK